MPETSEKEKLRDTLVLLERSLDSIAIHWKDATSIRKQYVDSVRAFSKAVMESVARNEMTAEEASKMASQMRNTIMDNARQNTKTLAKSIAEFKKSSGITYEELLAKYSSQRHKKNFKDLNHEQRNGIYKTIIEKAGTANDGATKNAIKIARVGNGFLILSLFLAVMHISKSKRKFRALAEEVATLSGAIVVGETAAFGMAIIMGPGAPLFVGTAMFLGGMFGADFAHKTVLPHFDQEVNEINAKVSALLSGKKRSFTSKIINTLIKFVRWAVYSRKKKKVVELDTPHLYYSDIKPWKTWTVVISVISFYYVTGLWSTFVKNGVALFYNLLFLFLAFAVITPRGAKLVMKMFLIIVLIVVLCITVFLFIGWYSGDLQIHQIPRQ